MNTVYRRVHLSGILNKLDHFLLLKRKFFMIPPQNHRTLSKSILSKSFLNSHGFQVTRASSTISYKTNRADKIILNIFGVAM